MMTCDKPCQTECKVKRVISCMVRMYALMVQNPCTYTAFDGFFFLNLLPNESYGLFFDERVFRAIRECQ